MVNENDQKHMASPNRTYCEIQNSNINMNHRKYSLGLLSNIANDEIVVLRQRDKISQTIEGEEDD